MIQSLSDHQVEELARQGAAELRKERSAAAPTVINLDAALQLGEPLPLYWRDGQTFQVRPISYMQGLELLRAQITFDRWSESPPSTEEETENCEADLIQTLTLFHTLLADAPAENPFLEASPREVGALLGFFSMSLTLQGALSQRAGDRLLHTPTR